MSLKSLRPALGLLALALVAGCKEDPITQYQEPKAPRPAQRLLGAIIPHRDGVWFFKLVGPPEQVGRHEAEFTKFIESVRFPDGGKVPVTWTAPEDWTEKAGGHEMRFMTFQLEDEPPLELIVTRLGAESDKLLENVNRWRGQMGLAHATAADLDKLTKKLKVDGKDVTLVDLKAEAIGKGFDTPIAGKGRPSWKVPKGWEKVPPVQFSIAAFRVKDGDQQADTTVSPLSERAGGLASNLSRWRGQVGLNEVSEEALLKDLKEIEVDGHKGQSVDLSGPEGDETKRKRILGVIVPQGGSTWFIKMTGPYKLVEAQKSNFEAFVKSIRFGAGAGAKP